MIKVTVKTLITLAVAVSADGGPLFKSGIFGTVYLLMNYFIWHWDQREGFFEYIRKNGFPSAMSSMALMFLLPTTPLAALALIMETGETIDTAVNVMAAAAGLGCFTQDCIHVWRAIKKS